MAATERMGGGGSGRRGGSHTQPKARRQVLSPLAPPHEFPRPFLMSPLAASGEETITLSPKLEDSPPFERPFLGGNLRRGSCQLSRVSQTITFQQAAPLIHGLNISKPFSSSPANHPPPPPPPLLPPFLFSLMRIPPLVCALTASHV